MPADTQQIKTNKKQRWNKNKKKNWRGKIDLKEVEEGLEKERLQLRTGGIVKHKKNSELFIVEKIPAKKPKLTTRERARNKVLRVDKILGEPVVEIKTRVVKKAIKKPKKSVPAAVKVVTKPTGPPVTDLWSASSEQVKNKLFNVNDVSEHTLNVIGKTQKPKHMFKAPKSICSTAVEPAHAGSSYNPTFNDHQNLLAVELDKELKRKAKEEKIERAIHVNPETIVTDEIRDQELKEGLFDVESSDDDNEDEDGSNDELHSSVTQPKPRKKRRREQMAKQAVREKEEEKAKRIRENEVFRTKTLIAEIKKEKEASQAKKALKEAKKDEQQPQLSYMKFEEPDHDLQLSEEIAGSLRNLKPEGDVMVDRFKSFQKRCILEPRKKFKTKKRDTRIKYQEKRNFREISL